MVRPTAGLLWGSRLRNFCKPLCYMSIGMKMKPCIRALMGVVSATLLASTVLAQQPQDKGARRVQNQRSSRLAALNAEEQNRLRAAHEKALMDMQVRAAREHLQQARREFRDVMGPALLRADPSVQPILEKLRRPARADRDRD